MPLLTDDQKMLQETAASFLRDEGGPAKQLRKWRDSGCTDGFGTDFWQQFGELGLTGICIPEAQGGLGLGCPTTDPSVIGAGNRGDEDTWAAVSGVRRGACYESLAID